MLLGWRRQKFLVNAAKLSNFFAIAFLESKAMRGLCMHKFDLQPWFLDALKMFANKLYKDVLFAKFPRDKLKQVNFQIKKLSMSWVYSVGISSFSSSLLIVL